MTDDSTTPAPVYTALALQTACHAVGSRLGEEASREAIARAIERIGRQIASSKRFLGPAVRLVVLPEYFLTGFPGAETLPQWAGLAALDPDGPEYESLARIASDQDLFLAGNAYETDRHFPGLYFQTSFVLSPAGEIVLRYRRLISLFAPTPHDVLDRYLEIYGADALFPVARTEIGCLAAIASEEILYPEIARCLAVRGAEVFVHSSSEVASPLGTPKQIARRARAIENMAFVVSANSARVEGLDLPAASADGKSEIIDDRGLILCRADTGETMAAAAEIDLVALRRRRRAPGMANLLSRQALELFGPTYSQHSMRPANSMLGDDGQPVIPERKHFSTLQRRVIDRLAERGII